MADTYSVAVNNHAATANLRHISVFNGAESGKIVKICVAECYSRPTTTITGRAHCVELWRVSAVAGGSTMTPDKHDTTTPDLSVQIVCRNLPTSHTVVGNPIAAGNTYTEETSNQQMQTPFHKNDGDELRKQITLREGEGVIIIGGPYTGTGVIGFKLTFVVE